MKWNARVKCHDCGKFCKVYDRGTMYGGTLDMEPPDEIFWCKKCYDKQVSEPEKVIKGCWWCKPRFVTFAEEVMREGNE